MILEERTAILEAEIQRWAEKGYRVIHTTATTAHLVRPKSLNPVKAVLGVVLAVLTAGLWLIVMLIGYLAQRDKVVYLSVDDDGGVAVTKARG